MGNKLEAGTLGSTSLSRREGKRREEYRGRKKYTRACTCSQPLFPSLSFTLFLLFLSSYSPSSPSPTLIRSQERVDRVAHTLLHRGSSGLERARALHPLRCSLENPTLFGSFDQSPPANYGLVMYRLLLGPPFFYVASRGPLLFFPFSSLFFCFFFVSLPSIRSNVRSCTRGSP